MSIGLLDLDGGPDDADAAMHNLGAALFGASAREMTRIVTLMGGRPENVTWLPGVGDQYVTCVGGRTIRLGRLLGAGLTYTEAVLEMSGQTLEGAYVIKQLAQALPVWEARGLLGRDELPLLRMLCRVITQDAPVESRSTGCSAAKHAGPGGSSKPVRSGPRTSVCRRLSSYWVMPATISNRCF